MEKKFDAVANYQLSRKEIGYLSRKDAANEDYKRIGFMSGLEVHQQLDTKRKLFCHCPAGIYHQNDDYNAEVIRHMRPTLSELGEYDGTALMEFKTKKEKVPLKKIHHWKLDSFFLGGYALSDKGKHLLFFNNKKELNKFEKHIKKHGKKSKA